MTDMTGMMERGLFRCHECNARFPGESDVQAHILAEHGEEEQLDQLEENFMCQFCEKKFVTEEETKDHVEAIHRNPPEPNFMCSYCEKKFVTEEETSEHVDRVHRNKSAEDERNGRFAATAQLAALLPSQNRRRLGTTDYTDGDEGGESGLRRRMPTKEGRGTMSRAFGTMSPSRILRQISRPEPDLEDEEDEDAEKTELIEELADLRNEPVALEEKKRRRRELLEEMERRGMNAVVERGRKQISSWTRRLHDMRAAVSEFALWKSTLRRIEGRYGTAVYSFFKFLKWAMGLNLIMSVMLAGIYVPGLMFNRENATCPIDGFLDNHNISWYPKNYSVECCTDKYQQKMDDSSHTFGRLEALDEEYGAQQFGKDLGSFLQNIFRGTGWFQYSALFYGFYSPFYTIYSVSYKMPIAYLSIMFCCFLVSLFLIVRSSSNSFHSSFKWNEHNSTQYFVLVFCSWDFCLDSRESADIKQGVIVNEMKTALETDAQQDKDNSRTKGQKFMLYMKRFFIRTAILCSFGGFAFLIYWLTDWVPDQIESQNCAAKKSNDDSSLTEDFLSECFWLDYMISIVITVLNMLLPYIFSYLIIYEEWAPGTALTIDLLQCMIVRLASLLTIMFTLYGSASCPTNTRNAQDFDIPFIGSNSTFQSCDNKYNLGKSCRGIQWDYCWETFVGLQFYQLAVLDLVIQLAMIVLVDLPRSRFLTCIPAASNIEFNITKHVLDIVYSQTITWMALFFSPLITLINFVKLFFIFFIRIFYVQYICKPTSHFFQASKASSIFKFCLLFSVVVTIFILGCFICVVPPSISCGAFKGLWAEPYLDKEEPNYFDVVTDLIHNWDSFNFGQEVLFLAGNLSPLLIICAVLVMIIYLWATRAVAFGAYNDRMEKELSSVASEKRLLMATLQQRMAEKTFNKLFNKGESIRR